MPPVPDIRAVALEPQFDAPDAALARLHDVTQALSQASTPDEVGEVLVRHAVGVLHARTGAVWVVSKDETVARVVHQVGWRPEHVPLFGVVTPEDDSPPGHVLARGEPVWLSSRAEYRARFPASEQRAGGSPELSVAVVPMMVSGTIVGVLAISFDRAVQLPRWQREVILSLTRMSAQALRRATLYEETVRAREKLEAALSQSARAAERLKVLAEVGEVLSTSLDYEQTLRTIIQVAIPRLGDFGFFDVVDGAAVRRIALAHENPARQAMLDGSQWQRSERTDINLCALSSGASAIHPDIGEAWLRDVAVSPGHLEVMQRLAFGSMLTVPLRYEGTLLGALTLFYDQGRRGHDEDDLTLATEIARRAAAALMNARLYRDTRAAVQLRDDFLSVASHELRTPLTTIDLHVNALLRQLTLHPELPIDPGKLQHKLERTEAQVDRLKALVEQLLDVSRIGTGLQLERTQCDLVSLAREVLLRFQDPFESGGATFELSAPETLTVTVDRERIDQVLTNLISNALKYGLGRPVELRVEVRGAHAALVVRDQGIGIDPADQERIFGRFERAASITHFPGLGLGLWIVRQIVELHGGEVRVESQPGQGATFTVVLPLRPAV